MTSATQAHHSARLRIREQLLKRPIQLALGAAMLASAVVVLWEGRHMTFFQDEWTLLLNRRGYSPDVLLGNVNGHLVLIPLLIYKALLAIFGASYTPFRVADVLSALLCAGLAFRLIQPRVGDLPALAAAILLLFLGVAWEDMLWALGITYYGALAAGLGMFLALERRDRFGDATACGLLTASIACQSIGLSFAVGAAVEVALQRGTARSRRIWIWLIPLALYAIWYAGWSGGHGATGIKLGNLPGVPYDVAQTAASAFASLFGLYRNTGWINGPLTGFPPFVPDFGLPLAVLAGALFCLFLIRGGRASPRLWALLVTIGTLWISFSLVEGPGRSPSASRYQYPDVLLVLLLAAEVMRGSRLVPRAATLIAVVLVCSVAVNFASLHDGGLFFSQISTLDRADLAALQIARGTVGSDFVPVAPAFGATNALLHLDRVRAGRYFAFTQRYGSPADTDRDLTGAPESARLVADGLLMRAERVRLQPGPAQRPGPAARCAPAQGDPPGGSIRVIVPPDGLWLRSGPGATATVQVRRFAAEFHAVPGTLAPGIPAQLTPARDGSSRPWLALVTAEKGSVLVCRR